MKFTIIMDVDNILVLKMYKWDLDESEVQN